MIVTYSNKIFAIDTSELSPFYVMRIDPETEKVVEEFTTNHFRGVAISAEREERPDSWLSQEYDYWVLDNQSNIAYALKPTQWNEWIEERRYKGIHIVDFKTRQVKNFLEISPVLNIVLHPNREKLYVMTRPKEAQIETGEIRVYSTLNLALLKTINFLGGYSIYVAKFSQDGSRLFCCVHGRGILVVNTIDDQLESWQPSPNLPIRFGIEDRRIYSLDLAPDEKEFYFALRIGRKRGAVAAVDIAQKKVVRILELSPTGCNSVAVIGEKLFAACLDGVYVIDIPAWRQQQ